MDKMDKVDWSIYKGIIGPWEGHGGGASDRMTVLPIAAPRTFLGKHVSLEAVTPAPILDQLESQPTIQTEVQNAA